MKDMESLRSSLRVNYGGHATVLVDMGGFRILTDPILRNRIGPLRRRGETPGAHLGVDLDLIVISHVHMDHFDPHSLRMLDQTTPILVPKGAADATRNLGFTRVYEMRAGDTACFGSVEVQGVHAAHTGVRTPYGLVADCLGYVFRGSHEVYFAGDTGLFPEMANLAGRMDLALLPVWGWGPHLGDEHLTPYDAASSLRLLQPATAVPIHWGTFYPLGMGWTRPSFLVHPPYAFVHHAAKLAPEVVVEVVAPGSAFSLQG
ncbi:MAG: MBL fold metallo-hydrolase [Actinobacteria bacterium]|nr:MBL fold metallo-hydrolase [Actinomycetota bacterium]